MAPPAKRRKTLDPLAQAIANFANAPVVKRAPPAVAPEATTPAPSDAALVPSPRQASATVSNPDKAHAHNPKRDRKANIAAAPSKTPSDIRKAQDELPIAQYRGEIQRAVRNSEVLVLVGETGSGKSTQVPQYLHRQSWCKRRKVKIGNEEVNVGGMIAITQPRRVAATTLAHRVAREEGTPLKPGERDGTVGYSVRFDHKVPRGTRIKFLTEGMILQELLRDPNLRDYSAVIVDEIHERSLDVDLLVGFLKQMLAGDNAGRGGIPLKVIIMSATADVEVIQSFFRDIYPEEKQGEAIQVLKIEGRQYPVQTIYEPEPVTNINDALVDMALKVHTQEPFPGDILAFFIGQEEIESAQKLIEQRAAELASNVPKIKVVPLYGQLSMEAQKDAFMPVKAPFTRKIVLATNIAETSVTVPGVRYVIDCGKAKVKQFRTRLGMESLLVKPISKSSAIQRKGRAGREGPGKCFRLYTEEGYEGLREADLPEILRNDVLGAVLTMKARGIQDVINFPLIDPPDIEAIKKAMFHLYFLGALDQSGQLTPEGSQMARLPLPAPLATVLLAAPLPEYDCLLEAIDVVSLITAGGDIFLQLQSEEEQEEIGEVRSELHRREGDIITLLTTMQRYTSENTDRNAWCQARGINGRNMRQALNIRRQLRDLCVKQKLLADKPPVDPQPFVPVSPDRAENIIKCFLKGFAHKVATLQPDGTYATAEGKHTVAIHPSSVLYGKKKEAIMFLEHIYTTKNFAKKVSAIQGAWILEAMESRYS